MIADRPRIECSVTFLAPSEGGRASLRAGMLSGNTYRPHLVIGDPTQRHAIVADGNRLVEVYIGVAFEDGPEFPVPGLEMMVTLLLMFWPHPVYDGLKPGVTFTVREGSKIVGHGVVRRRLG